MRVAVCDNDSAQIERITNMILNMGITSQCDAYVNPHDIVKAVKEGLDYDIVIININWNSEFNGMKAAEQISRLDAKTKIIYMAEETDKYVQEIF